MMYCMKCMLPLRNGQDNQVCQYCGFDGKIVPNVYHLTPGTVLDDRYYIGIAMGQGGFGITYVGRDIRLNKRIAIKEYYPRGYVDRNSQISKEIFITDKKQQSFIDKGKKRFLEEAQALAAFDDEPNIVHVYDYFEENQTAYIVMEYLDGHDLRKHLKDALFSADEIFKQILPIMDALEKIHEKNIIHRDISPDNIVLLKNGTLKLTDFGAARLIDYSDPKSISVVLKSGYAPEEQYRPKGLLGPWTDIYALSATLYKCITGITPDDALERGHNDTIRWPSELGYVISPIQEAVLKKGLEVRQYNRFQSIAEMKQVLCSEEPMNRQVMEAECMKVSKNGEGMIDEQSTELIRKTIGQICSYEQSKTEAIRNPYKSKLYRTVLVIGCGLAAIMAVFIGLYFGKQDETDSNSTLSDPTNSISEVDSTVNDKKVSPADIDLEDTHYMIFSGQEQETNENISNVFRERLNVLGIEDGYILDEKYGISKEDKNIILGIPDSKLSSESMEGMDFSNRENILKSHVFAPVHFYLYSRECWYNNSEPEYCRLYPDDIASAFVDSGELTGITDDYIKIVLTDACAIRVKKYLDKWGEYTVIGQDLENTAHNQLWLTENNTVGYYWTKSAGDGKTFFIGINTSSDDYAGSYISKYDVMSLYRLILHNLKYEFPLEDGVNCKSFAYRSLFHNNKYMLCSGDLTWKEAEIACESLGGHLATISDETEYKLMKNELIGFSDLSYVWLGGKITDDSNIGQWITGEQWNFANWYDGEPNHKQYNGKSEDSVCLWNVHVDGKLTDWKWNDEVEDIVSVSPGSAGKIGFICEFDDLKPDTDITGIGRYDEK